MTFQPHFNYSIGEYVTSRADFNDKLRAKSDAMSERLGFTTNYQPVDPADQRSAFNITDTSESERRTKSLKES